MSWRILAISLICSPCFIVRISSCASDLMHRDVTPSSRAWVRAARIAKAFATKGDETESSKAVPCAILV